jgi:hypothetical protein
LLVFIFNELEYNNKRVITLYQVDWQGSSQGHFVIIEEAKLSKMLPGPITGSGASSNFGHPNATCAAWEKAEQQILCKVSLYVYGKNPMYGQSRRRHSGKLAV